MSSQQSEVFARAERLWSAGMEGKNPAARAAGNELMNAESSVKHERKALIAAARQLAECMTAVADRLENDPSMTATANSLGEVQSYGSEVDRRCASLYAAVDHLKAVDRIAQALDSGEPS